MCRIIVINLGEKELSTPKDFKDHFNFEPIPEEGYNEIHPDCCLCQVDIIKSLKSKDIPFKQSCGDVYVGKLEGFIEDY